MNKEELKNIVLEILGNSNDSAFNQFIEKIASSIEGNQALKLNGIGHFQIKKEPLSRMERKIDGNISEKDILLFLPEGELNEENIISFEIDEQTKTPNKFSDSVFDVGINKPNILLDPESEVPEEESTIVDESLVNKINEFIESGEVIEEYELLGGVQLNVPPVIVDENINNEEIIIDDIITESSDDEFTEVEINKEFMNDDSDDENIEDNEKHHEIIGDDDYDVTSSSVEAEITEEDVNASEAEIPKTDIETEIETEIEAEIGAEFKTEVEEENIESNEEETNPFDELDDYIKDETNDEAQDIIDEESEVIEELENDTLSKTNSEPDEKLDNVTKSKTNEWYKNPILYIASLSLIVVIIVIYIFLPTTPKKIIGDESSSSEINNTDQVGLIDSVATSDSTIEGSTNIIPVQTTDEIKKVDEKVPDTKKNVSATKVIKPKMSDTPTGLYREIKNDKNIIKRIYFDGERYTVQSSSWKSTSIAEREVSKLKKRGFDAFIYKVYIPSKNSTWNRVRIGYFNTQKEAEVFLKKNKI